MSASKPATPDDPNANKPYLQHTCQGRYMEPGTPWEKSSVCSSRCDLRFECWAVKNGKVKPTTVSHEEA